MSLKEDLNIKPEDIIIKIMDIDIEFISLSIKKDHLYDFIRLKDFEVFAKKVYASYKKYKYVFEKGKK